MLYALLSTVHVGVLGRNGEALLCDRRLRDGLIGASSDGYAVCAIFGRHRSETKWQPADVSDVFGM